MTDTADKAGSETVLTEKPAHLDADGDTAMTEACDSAHHKDKEHEPRQDIVSAPGSLNTPFFPPVDSSPSSPTTSPTSNASPALGVSASDDRPPASAASPADALSAVSTPSYVVADENVPAYLTQAILAHLYDVSPASAWQDLVSAFLQFERASPPNGVSYYFSL